MASAETIRGCGGRYLQHDRRTGGVAQGLPAGLEAAVKENDRERQAADEIGARTVVEGDAAGSVDTRQQADDEESKYQELLKKVEQEVLQASEKDKAKLNTKIEELQLRIAEIEEKKRAISQAR